MFFSSPWLVKPFPQAFLLPTMKFVTSLQRLKTLPKIHMRHPYLEHAISSKRSFAPPLRPSILSKKQAVHPSRAVFLQQPIAFKSSGHSCQRGKVFAPRGLRDPSFTRLWSRWQQRYAVPFRRLSLILSKTSAFF
jgi:hypothetical protein